MPRPVTLFTGQWADLPFEEMCRLASTWGYDGLEIACWGDHFEVDRALNEPGYIEGRHAILKKVSATIQLMSDTRAYCLHDFGAMEIQKEYDSGVLKR